MAVAPLMSNKRLKLSAPVLKASGDVPSSGMVALRL